jgi:hypothetical protein
MSELLDSAPDIQPTPGGARPKPHAGTNDRSVASELVARFRGRDDTARSDPR